MAEGRAALKTKEEEKWVKAFIEIKEKFPLNELC
jgi:hypothetical protein